MTVKPETSELSEADNTEVRHYLDEKWKLVPSFLKVRGLVKQHLDSFNYFIDHEIKEIVATNRRITCEEDTNWFVEFKNIEVLKPMVRESDDGGGESIIFPHLCRLRDLTYEAPIMVDIEYLRGNRVTSARVCIGWIPIMLRSSHCHLYGLNREDSTPDTIKQTGLDYAQKFECPLDPGGYFITRGTEKIILIQEQASKNRILVEKDKNGRATAQVQSSTHDKKTRADVLIKKDRILVKQNQLSERDGVPVCIIFRALGIESDLEIASLVAGTDETLQHQFFTSLEDCHERGIVTQTQALTWLSTKLKPPPQTADEKMEAKTKGKFGKRRKKLQFNKIDNVKNWLVTTLLCHISPDLRLNFPALLYRKAVYLAEMVRRVLLADTNDDWADDRDYYGNKRLELAGSLMSLLFEDAFKSLQYTIQQEANRAFRKNNRTDPFDARKHMSDSIIKRQMTVAVQTGNWKIQRWGVDRKGVTQVVNRLSYMACMQKITEVKSQFEKSRKVSGVRQLQPSQWGMLCPSDTPEGEQCGLTKNLALMTHITVEVSEQKLRDLVYNLGIEDVMSMTGLELRHPERYLVFLNGTILGSIYDYTSLVQDIRKLRRSGYINEFVSVYASKIHQSVYISSDGGRLCRPYLLVDEETSQVLLSEQHLKDLKSKKKGFQDFLKEGIVEYLDVNEENDSLIAVHQNDIVPGKGYTHLEIEPFTLLGVCASLIPYPHHNQSPRNTYQCAMGRQAMGPISYNQNIRIDTLLYNLVYPQRPLVKSKPLEMTDFEKIPAGANACIAVMSYSGFDIEDALILNQHSCDRGYGRCIVYKSEKASTKQDAKTALPEKIVGRDMEVDKEGKPTGRAIFKHRALDSDGIAGTGNRLQQNQVVFNKATPNPNSKTAEDRYIPTPVKWKHTNRGDYFIENVMVTENPVDGSKLFKANLRQTRRPELGDKFSSRHGQKGVTGYIAQQRDMPFSDSGITPDVIMNPHGYPSRMTVGKLLELIGSKAGAIRGGYHYGTAFGEPAGIACKVDTLRQVLIDHNFNYLGKDCMTSGITGEPLEAYVFQGPVYYQKLKHMVCDKMHARPTGKIAQLTRQPTEGRSNDGGLRVGEMERDCLIAYGASALLMERMMISSDETVTEVCSVCGFLASNKWCQRCRKSSTVSQIKMPYACKLLLTELTSMNVLPKLILKESEVS